MRMEKVAYRKLKLLSNLFFNGSPMMIRLMAG
jgi:hypothetical protein